MVFVHLGTPPLFKAVMMLFFSPAVCCVGRRLDSEGLDVMVSLQELLGKMATLVRESLRGVVLWGVIIFVIQCVGCK